MATAFEKVLSVISKRPEQRQDFEVGELLPWLRKKSKLFATLKPDYLKDIGRNCGVRKYMKDDIIIKQGEIGDCFYIILGGKISIFIINKDRDTGSDGDEKSAYTAIGTLTNEGKLDRSKLGNFVTSLGTGFPFGEVALVSDDAIRTASIIAEEDNTDLLVVDRALYNRAVRDVLAAEFDEKQNFIKRNELFSSWIPKYKKQLTMAMYKETFPYDSVLIKQGDNVGYVYFIISGQVEIRADPACHHVQYPKLYKLLEDERDKLIKEKKNKKQTDIENVPPPLKKKDGTKTLKICYLGKNESLGELEVLMEMDTYMTTAVCTERTEVLVLEMKHYERLFVKRHQRTIDVMKRNLETKLHTRSSVLKEHNEIPLFKLIQMKLHLDHNPPQVPVEKKKKSTSVQNAEKLFFNPQGPLLDMDGPGSVFYMIRAREKSRMLLKAHEKERNKTKPSNQKSQGHLHAIRLPQSLVMAAQIAGATETKTELQNGEFIDDEVFFIKNKTRINERVNHLHSSFDDDIKLEHLSSNGSSETNGYVNETSEIDAVAEQNSPTSLYANGDIKRIQSAKTRKDSHDESAHVSKNVRRIQSAVKPAYQRINDGLQQQLAADGSDVRKFKSTSRHGARFENGNVDENLRELENKVKEWLRKDNPRRGANVSKLRRLQVEELEPRPKPGNKIVIRKRSKVSRSDASTMTGTSMSTSSTGRSNGRAPSSVARSEANSLDRFKILLTN